jgi:hypothetical protein
LTRSDVASTQINGGDKMALEPMKKFNMGIKMANEALTRAPMIGSLYHINYDTFEWGKRIYVAT